MRLICHDNNRMSIQLDTLINLLLILMKQEFQMKQRIIPVEECALPNVVRSAGYERSREVRLIEDQKLEYTKCLAEESKP